MNDGNPLVTNSSTGQSKPNTAGSSSLSRFTLNSSNATFINGVNTIDFHVKNLGQVVGYIDLRIVDFSGTTVATTLDLSSWAASFGLSGDDALPAGNPSKDGVNNLLKYAFNLNPTQSDRRSLVPGTGTAGLPVITSADAGTLRFEFIRRKNSGLT